MKRQYLSIYLNDHLAGSVAAVSLMQRLLSRHESAVPAAELTMLLADIEADRTVLKQVMRACHVHQNKVKQAGAKVAERIGRLKLNGHFRTHSPLSDFLELEALYLGITGKRQLWLTLQQVFGTHPSVEAFDWSQLISRADAQLLLVDRLATERARHAFDASSQERERETVS